METAQVQLVRAIAQADERVATKADIATLRSEMRWMFGFLAELVNEVLGFRRFSARGAQMVRDEWHLVCLALNIKRMAGLAAC